MRFYTNTNKIHVHANDNSRKSDEDSKVYNSFKPESWFEHLKYMHLYNNVYAYIPDLSK